MRSADFDYPLPVELVAQTPTNQRDQARLMVFRRPGGLLEHRQFSDVTENLRPGDLLILNDSRVMPARLRGRNCRTGGEFEILLLEENAVNDWWVLLRPGKRARPQTEIVFQNRNGKITDIRAVVIEMNEQGHRRLKFSGTGNISDELEVLGEIPLPPYIRRSPAGPLTEDCERYQTVYARDKGSVAAPTAGLHFTTELLGRIRSMGVLVRHVTLHIGLGTFAPVKAENLREHIMHEERFSIGEETAQAVNTAKREGRRVIAVGTTATRVLESAVDEATGMVLARNGRTRIFIHPPYRFKVLDALLTNFHLPRSSLIMLASAFAAPGETRGRELMLSAYAEAVRQRYRFFSYGDAMLIL